MKSIKYIAGSLVIFCAFNVFAGGKDYVWPLSGQEAEQYFNSLPKLTSTCAYAQNEVDANDNPIDTLKLEINGRQINSILCGRLGLQAYVCLAGTAWSPGPCKTN